MPCVDEYAWSTPSGDVLWLDRSDVELFAAVEKHFPGSRALGVVLPDGEKRYF